MKNILIFLFLWGLTAAYSLSAQPESDCFDLPEFQQDIATNPALRDALKGNSGLVKAWEVLSDLPYSFRSLDNIRAVDAFESLKPGSLQDIKSQLSTISSDAHQAFLNGIGHVGDNAVLSSSLTLNRIPSVQEIADATLRIKQYRIANGIPASKNFGYLEGSFRGGKIQSVNSKIWSSGPPDLNTEPQIFEAREVGWLRNTDSEYKMLNNLAFDLGGIRGEVYRNITGSLKIISELPYCRSCQGVIQQFNTMFPNIEITLIDGVR